MVSERNRWRRTMIGTLALLAGIAVLVFGAMWLIDFFGGATRTGADAAKGPWELLAAFDPETLQSALGSLAQTIAAVLGIAITVVSIIVQLAANRYTSRVADMFFRDRINLAVMGFFVIACINAVWASLAVGRTYVPTVTVLGTVAIVTAGLLILIPYFAYVFDFLDPEKVIARIGQQTLRNVLAGANRVAAPAGPGTSAAETRQGQTATSMEQLADVAVNAVSQKDKVIASDAIRALREVIVRYLPEKGRLGPSWFQIGQVLRGNPDFVALAPSSLDELDRERTWLEWKGLRALRAVYVEAQKSMPEMAHVVAIETRYVGEAALAAGDAAVLALAVKFMNTYLRAALNARDVRTAYNVLNQYRQLAEAMLRAPAKGGAHDHEDGGADRLGERVGEIGMYFKYYAQLGQTMSLGFVAETAAYDLSVLCELAAERGSPAHDRLLALLLELDKEAEDSNQEKALRGIRKAQAKLAAYYLLRQMTGPARRIFHDMAMETTDRLRSIRDELLSITSKDFWEVTDRGTNFDYVDDARKPHLRQFFDWFPDLGEPTVAVPHAAGPSGPSGGPS